jgi:hypothetical protein
MDKAIAMDMAKGLPKIDNPFRALIGCRRLPVPRMQRCSEQLFDVRRRGRRTVRIASSPTATA